MRRFKRILTLLFCFFCANCLIFSVHSTDPPASQVEVPSESPPESQTVEQPVVQEVKPSPPPAPEKPSAPKKEIVEKKPAESKPETEPTVAPPLEPPPPAQEEEKVLLPEVSPDEIKIPQNVLDSYSVENNKNIRINGIISLILITIGITLIIIVIVKDKKSTKLLLKNDVKSKLERTLKRRRYRKFNSKHRFNKRYY